MRSRHIFQSIIRGLTTTTPSFVKIKSSLLKASESVILNASSKTSSTEQVSQSIPRSYRAQQKLKKGQLQKRPLDGGAVAMLTIPLTTFGLGCWQIQRLKQKLEKIHNLESRTSMEPVDLPLDLRELDEMEYMAVKVTGEFCNDQELIVKPRHRHDAIRLSDPYGRMNEVGAQVITPFKVAGRHYKILIQRGWVPLTHIDPETRKRGQVQGQVEIVGVVRKNEMRPKFVPENNPLEGEWNYRDVEMMARMRNCAPVYLEATANTTIKGGPIAGQTLVNIRNEHMSYIITWFTLSAITSWMWYRRYLRPARL